MCLWGVCGWAFFVFCVLLVFLALLGVCGLVILAIGVSVGLVFWGVWDVLSWWVTGDSVCNVSEVWCEWGL